MNPRAGGAETVTFEIARRLVKQGHSVEWFSASFPGAAALETIDGIRIVRAGRQWTVHWSAFRRYRGKLTGRFDVVVDEVNTIPFFAPLWSNIPTVMFIHQLAREVWWYEVALPLSALGYLAEPHYLRVYRHASVLTVSASTRSDLRKLGFVGPITVIPEGLEPIAVQREPKPLDPNFLYVGRLAQSKRIEHIIRALALFRRATGTGTLRLVGSGSQKYQRFLTHLSKRLGVADNVLFLGRVATDDKHRLMAAAHALLLASVREGWGLVVSEANACGTPAIVYDVPGLRDSVRHEITGLVVSPKPECLAAAMIRLTTDQALYNRLAAEGQRWSRTFSFGESARLVSLALGVTSPA